MKRFSTTGLAVAILSVCALPTHLWAVIVYTENFDADHTANWTWLSSIAADTPSNGTGNEANFFFDYNTVGIPTAPHSTGGTTRGLKMQANVTGTAIFAGMSAFPNGVHVTGDFTMTFDVWQNFNGPFPAGGNGSTQVTMSGYGATGSVNQFPGGAVFRSVMFGSTADGGSGVDYRAYLGNGGFAGTAPVLTVAAGSTQPDAQVSPSNVPVWAAGAVAGSTNNSNAYYNTFLGQTATAAQLALFPQQTGTTAVGTLGMAWHTWVIQRAGNILTYTVDTKLIATIDTTMNPAFVFDGDDVYMGYFDINATSSTDVNSNALLFGLVDNISIDQTTVPPSISVQPANQLVTVGGTANFSVTAAPAFGGTLHYQWKKTLNAVTTNVGIDSSTLSLPNEPLSDNGASFKVVVSEDGNVPTTTSGSALLTVAPPACTGLFADTDADGDVDQADFGKFQKCYSGAHTSGSFTGFDVANCYCLDRNQDGDVDDAQDGGSDTSDLATFANCKSGTSVPYNPNCVNFFPTGNVVINEISYDQLNVTGGDITPDNIEYVELYNAGGSTVDISGWKLRASDTVGPDPAVGFPTGDNNPDYTVPGAPGSATTTIAAGGFYTIGSSNLSVSQSVGATDLWENDNEALQLLDGNKTVKDTLIYELFRGAVAIGAGEGGVWGNNNNIAGSNQTLARWVDGYDTGKNGQDFGLRPATLGTTNNPLSTITQYVPPNVDGGAILDTVTGITGSFQMAKVINPADATPASAGVAGVNPNVIPAPPGHTKAITCWDYVAGGGNMCASDQISTTDLSYDIYVYLRTSDITIAGAESTSFGIMGTTDSSYQFPDPDADFFGDNNTPGTGITGCGNTGVAWVYQNNNSSGTFHKRLFLVDAGVGGDSSPGTISPASWSVKATITINPDATQNIVSGWYRLKLAYTGSTGAVHAEFLDDLNNCVTAGKPDPSATFNFSTTPNLAGGFYVGYRESEAVQPLTLRPATWSRVGP